MILIFFGMIASGKSFLGQEYARRNGLAYFNTDRVRKELAGLDPTRRCSEGQDQGIYSPAFTRRTYDALLERAGAELAAGCSVVLDGSYASTEERARVIAQAEARGSVAGFIFCHCSEEEVRRRLEKRRRDPEAVSDGNWAIYLSQKKRFVRPDELDRNRLLLLDTEKPLEELLSRVKRFAATLA